MRTDLSALLRERVGHFELESGHHGQRWLELETLFLNPAAVRPLAEELAGKVALHRPEAICGPLIEGALVGMLVAEALGVNFTYTVRMADPSSSRLPGVRYALPGTLQKVVAGRRVAVVNDVINAGSAVRGTVAELVAHGAEPVTLGALLTLGDAAGELARGAGLPLEALDEDTNELWQPNNCPLCAQSAPLTPHPGF